MIRRPPRSTLDRSSAASDVYKRQVFNMYVFEEFTHREIATELNCTENTSKSQLYKARAILRKKILEKVDKQMIESDT